MDPFLSKTSTTFVPINERIDQMSKQSKSNSTVFPKFLSSYSNDYLLNNGRHHDESRRTETKRKQVFPPLLSLVSLWLRPIKRFRFSSCIPGVWIAVVIRTAQSRLMERLQAICMEIEKHNRAVCDGAYDLSFRVSFTVVRYIWCQWSLQGITLTPDFWFALNRRDCAPLWFQPPLTTLPPYPLSHRSACVQSFRIAMINANAWNMNYLPDSPFNIGINIQLRSSFSSEWNNYE